MHDLSSAQGTYLFDDIPIHTWSGELLNAQSRQVWWRANSSVGRGRMNYHHVQFAINSQGTVAEYLAGYQGSPANAPHPTNQGSELLSRMRG
jgi:hypothetical protein